MTEIIGLLAALLVLVHLVPAAVSLDVLPYFVMSVKTFSYTGAHRDGGTKAKTQHSHKVDDWAGPDRFFHSPCVPLKSASLPSFF